MQPHHLLFALVISAIPLGISGGKLDMFGGASLESIKKGIAYPITMTKLMLAGPNFKAGETITMKNWLRMVAENPDPAAVRGRAALTFVASVAPLGAMMGAQMAIMHSLMPQYKAETNTSAFMAKAAAYYSQFAIMNVTNFNQTGDIISLPQTMTMGNPAQMKIFQDTSLLLRDFTKSPDWRVFDKVGFNLHAQDDMYLEPFNAPNTPVPPAPPLGD